MENGDLTNQNGPAIDPDGRLVSMGDLTWILKLGATDAVPFVGPDFMDISPCIGLI